MTNSFDNVGQYLQPVSPQPVFEGSVLCCSAYPWVLDRTDIRFALQGAIPPSAVQRSLDSQPVKG